MLVCNAFAERMVKTFKDEMAEQLIIYNETDLRNCLKEYVEYYNYERSHSSLKYSAPKAKLEANSKRIKGKIVRKKVLDGLITTYSYAG